MRLARIRGKEESFFGERRKRLICFSVLGSSVCVEEEGGAQKTVIGKKRRPLSTVCGFKKLGLGG